MEAAGRSGSEAEAYSLGASTLSEREGTKLAEIGRNAASDKGRPTWSRVFRVFRVFRQGLQGL